RMFTGRSATPLYNEDVQMLSINAMLQCLWGGEATLGAASWYGNAAATPGARCQRALGAQSAGLHGGTGSFTLPAVSCLHSAGGDLGQGSPRELPES
ncbi:unnamed protein product, partial [Bubo scandiacus]